MFYRHKFSRVASFEKFRKYNFSRLTSFQDTEIKENVFTSKNVCKFAIFANYKEQFHLYFLNQRYSFSL